MEETLSLILFPADIGIEGMRVHKESMGVTRGDIWSSVKTWPSYSPVFPINLGRKFQTSQRSEEKVWFPVGQIFPLAQHVRWPVQTFLVESNYTA